MTYFKVSITTILFSLFFMASLFSNAQTNEPKLPSHFFPKSADKPEVLLVGTFHFGYPGQDAHKTAEDKKIDILSDEKQKEIEELVEYIARFKPTKIAVEAGKNTGYLMHRKAEVEAGNEKPKRQEIDQLAFRLMNQFGLDTLYGTDARGMISDIAELEGGEPYLENIMAEYDWKSDSPLSKAYTEYYEYIDDVKLEFSLLEVFKYMNTNEFINYMHGAYTVGDFKLDDYKGADALAMLWYSRNIRIFRNIQQINATADDRVLVLYGAGHIPILKQLFECSPEFDVVEFGDLSLEN